MKRLLFRFFVMWWLAVIGVPDIVSAAGNMTAETDPLAREDYAWRSLNGPWKAFVSGISLDPVDSNHAMVSTSAGVFHTFNHFASWIRRSSGMPLTTCPTHFRRHPEQPDIIYATGSGPYHASCEIFRSSDGGLTWSSLNIEMPFKDIWIPSGYPDRVIAGSTSGVFLSEDSGASWTCIDNEHAFFEFAENPDDTEKIYAVVDRGALAISVDGGESWTFKANDNEEHRASVSYASLAVSSGNPPLIITGWHWMDSSNSGQLLRTPDEGESWTLIMDAPINRIRAAPSDTSRIWACGGTYPWAVSDPSVMFLSRDSGVTWIDMSEGQLGSVIAAAIDPQNPSKIYLGKIQNGLFISEDGGDTWKTSSKYMANSTCFDLTLQRNGGNLLCASDNIEGLFMTDERGFGWQRLDTLPTKNAVKVAFKPDEDTVMVAGSRNMYFSDDTGQSWTSTNMFGSSGVEIIRFNEKYPSLCYVTRSSFSDSWGLWISSDGGRLWNHPYGNATALVVCPDIFDPDGIFLSSAAGATFMFLKSTDGGQSWNNIPGILLARAMCADPRQEGVFYINAFSSPIAKTTDGGETWETNLGSEISGMINQIEISEEDGRILLAAESGFWYSDDGGITWNKQNTGLVDCNLTHIAVRSENGKDAYYAGTSRAGVWKWMPLDTTPPSVHIETPEGGETYSPGETIRIDWNESDDEGVLMRDIFLSLDSGATWPVVIAGALDAGPPFTWTVNDIPSDTCRIKVVVYDASWNESQDVSSTDFSITGGSGNTPTPSPSPTPSVEPSASPSPDPSPTPNPDRYLMTLEMPEHHFSPGDACFLKLAIVNYGNLNPNVPIFVVLEFQEQFWMAPSWGHYPETFDHYTYSLPPGNTDIVVIPEFTWPETTGSGDGLAFLALATSPDYAHILSNIPEWTFGFSQ